MDQKPVCPFWENKKVLNKFYFRIFFLVIVLWRKKKIFANFRNKKFIFKVHVIFWKWKLCRACPARAWPNSPIVWNWTHTNIPDWQHIVSVFKNSKKVQFHSTLLYSRLGQIVTKIRNWGKKQFVVKLFYPKICKGNNFFYFFAQMACEFAWICEYLQAFCSPNF